MTRQEIQTKVNQILDVQGVEVEETLEGGFEIHSGVWTMTGDELRRIGGIVSIESLSVEGGHLTIRTSKEGR